MKKIMVNMQNYLMGQAIERILRGGGRFDTVVVEQPEQVVDSFRLLGPDILLMEVTGYTPWKLEERLRIRNEIKAASPGCRIVLIVDENTEKDVAERVKQAKADGLIDMFIYGSTSASFLTALLETV